MQHFWVPVEGGRLSATRTGAGPPALVLHGGPGLSDYTEGLADEISGLYECVRYQQRGTPPSNAPGPHSVERFVEDALAVLDAAGWETATLVGHSWGGVLAQHVVASHPARSDALVSVDAMGGIGPDGGWGELDANLMSRMPQDVMTRVAEMDQMTSAGESSEIETTEMLELFWPYYFSDPSNAPPMPALRLSEDVFSEVHESVLRLFSEGRPAKGLASFSKPALFLHGEDDPVPVDAVAATVAIMPNARLVTFERCGHFVWMEKPGAIRAAMEEWLAEPG